MGRLVANQFGWRSSREITPAAPGLEGVAVLIPAWQPDSRLSQLVAALRQAGVGEIVLVDDGSAPERTEIFRELVESHGIVLCRHKRNCGKGRALKTGFQHAVSMMPGLKGVVTADADGQHLPADIIRVVRQLGQVPERAVLGVRSFTGRVPLRSRWGNALTRYLFTLFTGHKVSDTQTGLRGLPLQFLPELLTLPGERYEYETAMLAHLCRTTEPPIELPIQTVYLDDNRGSHFHPLLDSLRVYGALLRTSLQRRKFDEPASSKPEKSRLRTA